MQCNGHSFQKVPEAITPEFVDEEANLVTERRDMFLIPRLMKSRHKINMKKKIQEFELQRYS
jgi:hypothetical protein